MGAVYHPLWKLKDSISFVDRKAAGAMHMRSNIVAYDHSLTSFVTTTAPVWASRRNLGAYGQVEKRTVEVNSGKALWNAVSEFG